MSESEVNTLFGIDYLRKTFTHEQRYLIVAALSLFLPFYMCAGVILLLVIRLLLTGEIQDAYKNTPYSMNILIFCLFSCIVSVIYSNYLGALISIVVLGFLSLILYYRQVASKALFEFLLTLIMYLGVLAAFYALIEYVGVLNKFDIDQLEIIVFNSPKYRINSVYFNANYYAMMIEFFIGITFYKLLRIINEGDLIYHVRKIIELSSIIFLNLFVLYLTGCRTAWPALLLGLLTMLVVNHNKVISAIIGGATAAGAVVLATHPHLIPRASTIQKYIGVRKGIWKTAWMNIKTHPLFGEGPLTYYHVYKKYGGHPTQHAHNLYIDPLLNYGVIGLVIIAPFIFSILKQVYCLYKSHINDTLCALIIGFIVMVLIHGFLDLTIFFVQTGFLFLLVVNSFDVYRDRLKKG